MLLKKIYNTTKMKKNNLKVFILDVDGVMTTGQFFYNKNGKFGKIFGPDDHDALSLIKEFLEVRFITGDKKGVAISKKRIVKDMNFKLDLVSTVKRLDWIKRRYSFNETIYMGDGIMDIPVMEKVFFHLRAHIYVLVMAILWFSEVAILYLIWSSSNFILLVYMGLEF